MKTWLACGTALVLLLGSVVQARANGGRPPLPPGNIQFGQREVKIVVEVDERAKDPRLVVPAQLLAPPAKGPGAELGRPATMLAGLALTLAFVSGGFWLLRKGPARTLALLFAVSLVLAGGAAVQADLPREPPTKQVKLPAEVTIAGNKGVLEIVPFGDTIRLIMPKGAVKAEAKPEPKEEK